MKKLPPNPEFDELVANYKGAIASNDFDKAELYKNEILAFPNSFEELVSRIP